MDVLLYLGAAAAALLGVGAVLRVAWGINRQVMTIVNLVQELAPDHGRSLKDQVTCLARDVGDLKAALTDLCQRFDRHMADRDRRPA